MKARYLLLCVAMLFCGTLSAAEPDVAKLTTDLKAGGEASYKAADELADAPADKAIPALTSALDSKDVELQRRAARSLAQFGKEAESAVPKLSQLLDSPVPKLRAYAAYALGKIGDSKLPALPKLIQLVTDEDAMVRRSALEALLDLNLDSNVSLPILVDVLEKADPAMVLPVLSEMAEQGERAIPRLRTALKNEQAAYWACLVAEAMGPKAAPLVPELTAVLSNKDPGTRMHALIALGEIGPEAKPAMDAVINALENDSVPAVKYSAAFALASMEADKATDALKKAAEGEDAFLTLISYYAVAKLNPNDTMMAQTAATFLVEAMKNEDANVRAAAAHCLANLEASPDLLQPILADALRDADPRVVAKITDAIVKMGPQAMPDVLKGLKDDKLRWVSVSIIRRWGEAAPEAVEPLTEALSTDDEQYQGEVLMAIGSIGDKAAGAVESVKPFLKGDSRSLKLNALYALGRMGQGAMPAKGDIMPLLDSNDSFTKFAAAWALANIAPEDAAAAEKSVPILTESLTSSEQGYIPGEAAKALAMFGDKAKSALPALKKAADAGNEAAAEAVEAISKP
ncbi:HEAT repeat domain-containing protein [Blastopirellula marina]|nr:HEAT repeat domain-containing protein [Blastopirellula marina]